jgi:glycosyltransferase involved in cell wall biosynthesis
MKSLRIAVVHDWLLNWNGGSERVVAQILKEFPAADVFSLFENLPAVNRDFLNGHQVHTSFLQTWPWVERYYRRLLPLMPLAIESLDLSGYDLILSSSHAVAKGVISGPSQLHICYCHTPVRYAWDLQHQYLRESHLDRGLRRLLATWMLQYIRMWDLRAAAGVDVFLSNSHFVARRIEKIYRRQATVLYPPVDVDAFEVGADRDDFYLVVARLVPYKRVSLLLKAFEQLPSRRLIVIGDGPQLKELRAAAPSNVSLLGRQSFASMHEHLQRARAFLYAAEEDFGISIVEAQACGTPVITYGAGGALETVIDGQTGVFFDEQSPESIREGIRRFESMEQEFDADSIRDHALRFNREDFGRKFRALVLQECLKQEFNPALRQWAESQVPRRIAVEAASW